jgi:hypothetical protein
MWNQGRDACARYLLDPRMYSGAGMLAIALAVIFVPGMDAPLGWFLCCLFVTLGLIPE